MFSCTAICTLYINNHHPNLLYKFSLILTSTLFTQDSVSETSTTKSCETCLVSLHPKMLYPIGKCPYSLVIIISPAYTLPSPRASTGYNVL